MTIEERNISYFINLKKFFETYETLYAVENFENRLKIALEDNFPIDFHADGISFGSSLLHLALLLHYRSHAYTLISYGANVNKILDDIHNNALLVALDITEIQEGRLLRAIIDKTNDLNYQNLQGENAFKIACNKYLLYGNIKQKNDELPEVIKLLIQKKITFNIKDINVDLTNYYPWDNASQRKTRLRILQQYIAQYYYKNELKELKHSLNHKALTEYEYDL